MVRHFWLSTMSTKKRYTIRDTTWPTWPELHLSCFIWKEKRNDLQRHFSLTRYNPSTTEPKLQKQVLWRMFFKKNAFHPKKTRNNLFNSTTKTTPKTNTQNPHLSPKKSPIISPSPSFFSASSFSAFSFCPGTGWPQRLKLTVFFFHHGQPGSDFFSLEDPLLF